MTPPPTSKNRLRRRILALMKSVGPDLRQAAGRKIVASLEESAKWIQARTIALYWPLPSEPPLDLAINLGWRQGKRIGLPMVTPSGMEFRCVTSREQLSPPVRGLWEPNPERSDVLTPDQLDLIVVPGVAFTPEGGRLGRGGGYYDRFLADLPSRTFRLAFAYPCQMVPTLPREAHDQDVDLVVVCGFKS